MPLRQRIFASEMHWHHIRVAGLAQENYAHLTFCTVKMGQQEFSLSRCPSRKGSSQSHKFTSSSDIHCNVTDPLWQCICGQVWVSHQCRTLSSDSFLLHRTNIFHHLAATVKKLIRVDMNLLTLGGLMTNMDGRMESVLKGANSRIGRLVAL